MKQRILIAGVGNIFFGDDGFGCEVVRQLAQRPLPAGVQAIDFGIRSYDLAYSLVDGLAVAILVDAMARGEPPGTLAVIEPDLNRLDEFEKTLPDGHSLNPVSVLQWAQSVGSLPEKLLLVACEPAVLHSDKIGLSEPVLTAVPRAITEIESLIEELLSASEKTNVCLTAG